MEKIDIGPRLRRLRKNRNLTQEQLARRADLNYAVIGHLERGTSRDPHASTLNAIANALDISIGELLGEGVTVDLSAATLEELPEVEIEDAAEHLRLFLSTLDEPESPEHEMHIGGLSIVLAKVVDGRESLDETREAFREIFSKV